jgi:glycosyltransferase involved in cell wall biosynthesis
MQEAKDADTVWRAFDLLPDWRLLVAGSGVADTYQRSVLNGGKAPECRPVVLEGFLDEGTKDRVYSAADVAIISFRTGRQDDSASVTDAISWGLPVVCSDSGEVAETVRKHGLGMLFETGDPCSLATAIERVPHPIRPVCTRARLLVSPRSGRTLHRRTEDQRTAIRMKDT